MKLTKISPILYTNDLQSTMDFYVQKIGFTCDNFNEDLGWCSIQLDNVEIMLSHPNMQLDFQKPNFTGSFYINTDCVEEFWQKLKDKANVCYPIENFEYGMREFAIYDNNNYLLQFGQEISRQIAIN